MVGGLKVGVNKWKLKMGTKKVEVHEEVEGEGA